MVWICECLQFCSQKLPNVHIRCTCLQLFVQLWPCINFNWLFLWDYTFYKCGYVSTYNVITGISGHSCTNLPSPSVAVRLSPLAAAQYDLRLGARAGGRGLMQAANAPMGPWVWHGPGAIFSRSKSEVQSGSKDWLLRKGMKCICLKFAWCRHILPSEELFF